MAALKKWWFILPALILLAADFAMARPGGGSSYGGGSSGGGGGDGGEAIGAIIYLILEYPQIGIPLVILFIIYRLYMGRKNPGESVSVTRAPSKIKQVQSVNLELRQYQRLDPQFSTTIFLDFAQHLYYQFHHWRGKEEFRQLAPFIRPDLLQDEIRTAGDATEISELVIGNLSPSNLQLGRNLETITVVFEANYTETRRGHSNRLFVKDQWIFGRQPGVQSKGPDDMSGLHCPNCGSHLEVSPTGACLQCGQVVQPGTQHWTLINRRHLKRQVSRGQAIGNYTAEQGNRLANVVDPQLHEQGRQFVQSHQIPDMGRYFVSMRENVIYPIFQTIYASWEAQDYQKARPLMTDNLFRTHKYWLDTYRKAGVVNRLENLKIKGADLVKIELDQYYESVTVRIRASVLDYLENASTGKLVAGNSHNLRSFTEYWTFVRRTGVEKPEESYQIDQCPNCGAPVDMGMTGICSYCNSKVTTGEFSWILSRITQDEAYVG